MLKNKSLFYSLLFIVLFILSLIVGQFVNLPFSNPYDVIGILSVQKINPNNDTARYLIALTLPLVGILLFYKKVPKSYDGVSFLNNKLSFGIKEFVLFLTLVILCGNVYNRYYSIGKPGLEHKIDLLHEGESLGTAIGILEGQSPYKDMIFLHGLFKDPGVAIFGFKLFGKKISSYRLFQSLLNITALILSFALLFFLTNKTWSSLIFINFLAMLLLYKPFDFGLMVMHRDLPLIAITFLVLALGKNNHSNMMRRVLICVIMNLSLMTLIYSVDRGVYVSVASLIWFFFYIVFVSPSKIIDSMTGSLGALFGGFIFLYTIDFNFNEFVSFVFLQMPKYKDLMDSLTYNFMAFPYWLFVGVICANTYYLFFNFVKSIKAAKINLFFKDYVVEIFLLLTSIVYFKSALGRSDAGHVWYSMLPSFLLCARLSYRWFGQKYKKSFSPKFKVFISVLLLSQSAFSVDWSRWYKFDLREDVELVKKTDLEIRDELVSAMNIYGRGFVTFTTEPGWYYLTGEPSGVRFYAFLHGIANIYQEEMIKDLEKVNVILLTSDSWTNRIDGFENSDRFKIMFDYVYENFEKFKTVHSAQIWVRKN